MPNVIAGRPLTAVVLVAAIIVAIAAPTAHAWGAEGHKIVAYLADHQFDKETTERVAEILDAWNHFSEDQLRPFFTDYGKYNPPQAPLTYLSEIANLPDAYDHYDGAGKVPEAPEGDPRKTSGQHYMNAQNGQQTVARNSNCVDMADDHPSCVVSAIEAAFSVLRDWAKAGHPKLNPAESIEVPMALMYIVHYTGDIHQPLHISYEDDVGGNRVKVNPPHDSIIRRLLGGARWYQLGRQVLPQSKKLSHREYAEDDVLQWAIESFNYVKDRTMDANDEPRAFPCHDGFVYHVDAQDEQGFAHEMPDCSNGVRDNRGSTGPHGTVMTVSEFYMTKAEAVVKKRLALAGRRLAWLLNAALSHSAEGDSIEVYADGAAAGREHAPRATRTRRMLMSSRRTASSSRRGSSDIGCRDESGNAVDWWVAFKKPRSYDYLYADTNQPSLRVSEYSMRHIDGGAQYHTVNQIYVGDADGHAYYNGQKQDGKDGEEDWSYVDGNGGPAHAKGVIGVGKQQGLWLMHTVPKSYALEPDDFEGISDNGEDMGQTFMCVTLDKEGMDTVGEALLRNRPGVYSSSFNAAAKKLAPKLAQVAINHDSNFEGADKSFAGTFTSAGGTEFHVFGKTHDWNKELYTELVVPETGTNLILETFMLFPPMYCADGVTQAQMDTVRLLRYVDFSEVPNADGWVWTWKKDHSKWAIADDAEHQSGEHLPHMVCLGDINREEPQRRRGGGALCFENAELHQNLMTATERRSADYDSDPDSPDFDEREQPFMDPCTTQQPTSRGALIKLCGHDHDQRPAYCQ